MADALDFLRKAALHKRINGVAGGNRIVWQDKDLPTVVDYVMAAKPEQIIRSAQQVEFKLSETSAARVDLAKLGIEVRSGDIGPDENPLFVITTPRVDLAGDSNDTANVDISDFFKISSCPRYPRFLETACCRRFHETLVVWFIHACDRQISKTWHLSKQRSNRCRRASWSSARGVNWFRTAPMELLERSSSPAGNRFSCHQASGMEHLCNSLQSRLPPHWIGCRRNTGTERRQNG